jgi:hypothetical protein
MSRLALGPTQCSIQWILGAVSPRVKWPGHEADHSSPSSAKVNNAWSYTSSPPDIMSWCLIIHRDSFTFTLHSRSQKKWGSMFIITSLYQKGNKSFFLYSVLANCCLRNSVQEKIIF